MRGCSGADRGNGKGKRNGYYPPEIHEAGGRITGRSIDLFKAASARKRQGLVDLLGKYLLDPFNSFLSADRQPPHPAPFRHHGPRTQGDRFYHIRTAAYTAVQYDFRSAVNLGEHLRPETDPGEIRPVDPQGHFVIGAAVDKIEYHLRKPFSGTLTDVVHTCQ
jgi:hypothetical protein